MNLFWITLIGALAINLSLVDCQYLDDNIFRTTSIHPTPALDLGDKDVATVLLVDNDNRGSHGRFLNVKPTVGLLTSTARTFIQEGITTEYATQVLGTTLNNGKLYAQFLTKSSRVLYDRDNENNLRTKSSYLNDIIPNQNWNNVINSEFIKNTDDFDDLKNLNTNPAFIVYPTKSAIILDNYDTILKLTDEKFGDKNEDNHNRIHSQNNINYNSNNINNKVIENYDNNDNVKIDGIFANKVLPQDNLPTFTIRNEFSPSGFSYDDQQNMKQTVVENQKINNKNDSRLGKKIFLNSKSKDSILNTGSNNIDNENLMLRKKENYNNKLLTSVTYYGFADFTTVVGDTIIIFSPSTSQLNLNAHVTSIKGEATLYSQNNANLIKPTRISDELNTFLITQIHQEIDNNESDVKIENDKESVDEEEDDDDGSQLNNEMNVTEMPLEEITEDIDIEDENFDELEPSEINSLTSSTSSTQMLSTPSHEDISKIFASLAEAASKSKLLEQTSLIVTEESILTSVSSSSSLSSEKSSSITQIKIEPETQILGGATTIFFDDDPFLNLDILHVATPMPPTTNFKVNEKKLDKDNKNNNDDVIENDVEQTTTSSFTITTQELATVTESETTTKPKLTTIQNIQTTTEMNIDETTLEQTTTDTNETPTITTESNIDEEDGQTTIENEISTEANIKPECEGPLKLIPSTVFKTLTFLTTFFIPLNEKETTTSIESNKLVTSEISYNLPTDCVINPSKIDFITEPTSSMSVITTITTTTESSSIKNEKNEDNNGLENITVHSDLNLDYNDENVDDEDDDEDLEDGEEDEDEDDIVSPVIETPTNEKILSNKLSNEIELIYKTLYTTYTYLTTFFQDTTSSISSRKEVVTNVVSSTINPSILKSDFILAELIGALSTNEIITPTQVVKSAKTKKNGIGRPTLNNFIIPESDLAGIDNILSEQNNLYDPIVKPTPNLVLNSNEIKTYFTTYTYFTTIFVDGETEVSSRTEIYTNYVNIVPTGLVSNNNLNSMRNDEIENDEKLENKYSTMIRGSKSNELNNEIKMITDVKSSSSDGERTTKVIENRQTNNNLLLLEDQISSESNTEEIIPAPLLLLQTSYTTFTYFTTMYIGSSSSNILSRLETITNVVTEKLSQTQTLQVEDVNLPVTYFTTFTYWTTLFKDSETITTSREETISNVITPSNTETESIVITKEILPKSLDDIEITAISETQNNEEELTLKSSTVDSLKIEPTTYYTTYTYFTTSYIGDETVLNSRFETVTNVIIPSEDQLITSPNIESTMTLTDELPSLPTGIVSLNHGKIVDSDGISTLFYTTKAIGQYVDDAYTEVTESTSSLDVNTEKQKEISVLNSETHSTKQYKTGLVRSIDGTIIYNKTTTLYQSKVIGTVIDGRYAQIIESTSKLLIEKTVEPTSVLQSIDATTLINQLQSSSIITLAPNSLEGSIIDDTTVINEFNDEDDDDGEDNGDNGYNDDDEDDDEEDGDSNNRKVSRLTFQTRKRTFTPVIRPFASRNRPTFNPKRKNVNPSSATIITRSDFTPTITATPALKVSETNRGRSGNNLINNSRIRSSGSILPNSGSNASSRRFLGRPRGSSTLQSSQLSTSRLRASSTLNRNNISPASANYLSSSRRNLNNNNNNNFKSSSVRPQLQSSLLYSNNQRFNRIRSSVSSNIYNSETINPITISNPNINDEGSTDTTEDPTDFTNIDSIAGQTTTESLSSRRNQNPLLRFRRPPFNSRSLNQNVQTTQRPTVTVTTKRSPLLQRTRQTTPVPVNQQPSSTQRSITPFNRPFNFNNLQNRPRTNNNLFPPRGLLKQNTVQEAPDQNDEPELEDENNNINEKTLNDDDSEYAASEQDEVIDKSESTTVLSIEKRIKRQVEYGTRSLSYTPRFRRPTTVRSVKTYENEKMDVKSVEENPIQEVLSKQRASNRYQPRSRTLNTVQTPQTNRIRPTTSLNTRSQFTLREKDISVQNTQTPTRSSFRRPTTASTTRRKTSSSKPTPASQSQSRLKQPRLRSYGSSENLNSRNSNSRSRTNTQPTRGRTTTSRQRGRVQDSFDYTYVQPSFDGTITVTHHIPTEISIPVVNGKVTEYKNIVTAKISTEILGPKQYSTSTRNDGGSVLVLSNDVTGINNNGITEITHFILNETPTTSITFTPTTIRGRRTSYSHIIPSTIYDVEQVITTIQPQIAANAPLANILLSQLLLGNLNINQNINPLLGLQQQQQQIISMTPTTEYKTKTTTYVTTVTSSTSTVLPLTFRGKEILTTIVDSSTDVITATEFLTETIVVTPTQIPQQQQQLNSLLIPLLLQQQNNNLMQQQLQQPQQNFLNYQQNPKLDDLDDVNIFNLKNNDNNENLNIMESEEYPEQDTSFDDNKKYIRNKLKVNNRQETSVVTLYVSGRRPGEFSTILSTVVVGQDSTLRKRSADDYYNDEIFTKSSKLTTDNINDYDYGLLSYDNYLNVETQYLNELNKKHTEYLDNNLIIKTNIQVTPSESDFIKQSDFLA